MHIKNIKFFAFLYYWAYSLLKKIGSCIFFVLAIFFKKIAQVLHIKNINTFPLKKEKFSDIFEERAGDKKYIDAKLKRCSIFNVVAIASLIAATGGIGSPFIAMYVMTYSLTLENVKKENFFHYVMLLFGLLLLLAFAPQLIQFIEYLLNQLIKHFPENDLLAKIFTHKLIKYFFENNLLANIKTLNSRGNWYQIIIGSGVFLSLVIPYLNRFFTNLNNKKNEK
ncbi:hypothetical protein KAI65_02375 [Candidatus Parcubacteria bacterium]|nr:hypothetical protein [Candidatus Parcubacteria bacterium]